MSALTYAASLALRALPRERISKAVGRLADKRWPHPVGRAFVDAYCKLYGIDLGDYAQSEWDSFDSFFTRSLRDEARPLAEEGFAVSPADGRLDSRGTIDRDSTFLVKGRPYRVEELIGPDPHPFEGGLGCVVYLSPRDYHRVHAPVAGRIRLIRSFPGDYYPVNDIGIRHVPNLFVRNRRVAVFLDTPHGAVAVILVAAIVVGRITVTGIDAWDVPFGDHVADRPVSRGDELGIFHLGSTAVVLFEKRGFEGFAAEEGPIRLGQRLVRTGVFDARVGDARVRDGGGR
jgi:phosphatidylserine decarboxylase